MTYADGDISSTLSQVTCIFYIDARVVRECSDFYFTQAYATCFRENFYDMS